MFTGIITDVGIIKSAIKRKDILQLEILSSYSAVSLTEGCSICCSGICLTVKEFKQEGKGSVFLVEASPETIERTTIRNWEKGTRINLERALKAGDELGGHIVTGHIDDTTKITEIRKSEENQEISFFLPQNIKRFVAEKGSITIDGVSLTVNGADDSNFRVNIIPYTIKNTIISDYKLDTEVNIEIDIIARYLNRIIEGGSYG